MKKYTDKEIESILKKEFGLSERAAIGYSEPVVEKEGILTVTAIGLVEGILNNYRELSLSDTWKDSLNNNIIINPDHSHKILDVLSFEGKASIGSLTLTKEELEGAFPKADISGVVGKKVKTLSVSFEIDENEKPEYYKIAKRGHIKHWSITSYDSYQFCANPDKINWAASEAYDAFKEYKQKVVLPNADNLDYFYTIVATDIVGLSPVLFPSQRLAYTSLVTERDTAQVGEQNPNDLFWKQLQEMANNK